MRFRQFLWLLMFGLWFATSAPASLTAFASGEACGVGSVKACAFFILPYDAQNPGGISYDGPVSGDCIYDTASVRAAGENEADVSGERLALIGFPGFLAAEVTTPIGELRAAGLRDAHHVVQDAAVRDLAGDDTQLARGVQLPGPSTAIGTPHYIATQIQRQAGGGTLGAELRIGYKSLRQARYSEAEARQAITEVEAYFNSIGAIRPTPTRIPGNR